MTNLQTKIPSGRGRFLRFGRPVIKHGRIFFYGEGSNNQRGIYTIWGGKLTKVIDANHSMDGKVIESFRYRPEGVTGDSIAFVAEFSDRSQAIVRAKIVESHPPLETLREGQSRHESIRSPHQHPSVSSQDSVECVFTWN